MSTFSKIDNELIAKYLKNELTKSERIQLIEWLESDPENKEFLFGMKEVYLSGKRSELKQKADTANEWEKIRKKIKPPKKKIYLSSRTIFIKRLSIVAAMFMFFIVGYKADKFLLKEDVSYFTVETKAGEHTSVILSDGTSVKLNSMTKLTYPAHFNKGVREVQLDGEALFDVKQKNHMPFLVNINNYSIKVLGTRFNVSAYATDSLLTTTLETGKIEITGLKNNSSYQTQLSPGNEFVYQTATGEYAVRKADVNMALGWATGKIIFKDASLKQIASRLEREFGYKFLIKSDEIAALRYTATIEKEDLNQILYNISVVTPLVDYTVNKETQTVLFTTREVKYPKKTNN